MCIPRLTEDWLARYITVSWQLGKENVHLSSLPRDTRFSREGVLENSDVWIQSQTMESLGFLGLPNMGAKYSRSFPDIALEDPYKSTKQVHHYNHIPEIKSSLQHSLSCGIHLPFKYKITKLLSRVPIKADFHIISRKKAKAMLSTSEFLFHPSN